MSGYVSGLCYEVKFGCPTTKAVAVALADHASQDGTKVFPSVKLIASKCEISRRTVQRALRRLETMGVLLVVRDGGSGPRDTREWKFDLHLLRTVAATETQQIMHTDKGDTMTPLENGLRASLETPKGVTDDIKGDTGDAQTFTNRQVEPLSAPLPPKPEATAPSGQSENSDLKGRIVRPSITITPDSTSWSEWMDRIERDRGPEARRSAELARRLEVAARWPLHDTPTPVVTIVRDPTGDNR
jgi:DNA-binding transcriptional regulator YhcF (GntR family)